MSESPPLLPDSLLNKNLAEIVRDKASSAFAEEWVGKQVDSYHLDSLIGTGTHGVVFRACRTQPYQQTVAIKLFPALKGQAEQSVRFREECQALADLDHPGIAKILTAGLTEDETPYLVMPLVEGIAIDDYVAKIGRAPRQIAELSRQLASAVAYAHERNVVHCDLKPDNILVDDNGQLTVTDFGLAIRVDRMQELTQRPSWVPGTVGYCAPEILTSRETATAAVDIYSVGAVIYKLLTGVAPNREGGWLDAMVATVNHRADPVVSLDSTVPTELATICNRCLARDPEARFGSAVELEAQIQKYLEDSPVRRAGHTKAAQTTILVVIGITILGVSAATLFNKSEPTTDLPPTQSTVAQNEEPLPEEEVERILTRIEASLLRPGAKDPAESGDFKAVFQSLKLASTELQTLLEKSPDNKKVRERAAIGYFLLGRAAHWLREGEYADENLARSEEMFRRLHRDYPDDGYMFDFFHTILVQATRAPDRERRDLLLLALGVITGLNEGPQENFDYKDALACTWAMLADVYVNENSMLFDFERGAPYAQDAFDLAVQTCESPDSLPLHRKHIMTSASMLSEIARFRGEPARSLKYAETAYVEAVRLHQALNVADTKNHIYDKSWKYAVALRNLRRFDEAETYLREAEQAAEELEKLDWPDAHYFPAQIKELRQSLVQMRDQPTDSGQLNGTEQDRDN